MATAKKFAPRPHWSDRLGGSENPTIEDYRICGYRNGEPPGRKTRPPRRRIDTARIPDATNRAVAEKRLAADAARMDLENRRHAAADRLAATRAKLATMNAV